MEGQTSQKLLKIIGAGLAVITAGIILLVLLLVLAPRPDDVISGFVSVNPEAIKQSIADDQISPTFNAEGTFSNVVPAEASPAPGEPAVLVPGQYVLKAKAQARARNVVTGDNKTVALNNLAVLVTPQTRIIRIDFSSPNKATTIGVTDIKADEKILIYTKDSLITTTVAGAKNLPEADYIEVLPPGPDPRKD